MRQDSVCRLITKDFHILQAMLERCGSDDPLEPLLRDKLTTAKILLPHDVPPDVVTLYSRVRYRVNERPATTRIVIHNDAHEIVGATLPITHPRGLALLGLSEHATSTVLDADGMPETIYIEEIVYQPQAANRLAEAQGADIRPSRPGDVSS